MIPLPVMVGPEGFLTPAERETSFNFKILSGPHPQSSTFPRSSSLGTPTHHPQPNLEDNTRAPPTGKLSGMPSGCCSSSARNS